MLTNYTNDTMPQPGDMVSIITYYDFIVPKERGFTGKVIAVRTDIGIGEVFAVQLTHTRKIDSFNWKVLYNIDLKH